MNDTTVRPFHVRAGKSGIRHPAHFLCSVGWPIGERLGIGLEEMVMAEENRPSICSFLFQNHFLYPNFEMFFNYLPLTNGQMGGSEAQKVRIFRKC